MVALVQLNSIAISGDAGFVKLWLSSRERELREKAIAVVAHDGYGLLAVAMRLWGDQSFGLRRGQEKLR